MLNRRSVHPGIVYLVGVLVVVFVIVAAFIAATPAH